MTGQIFWDKVSNASRFLTDAVDELLCERSVVLDFDGDVPWCEFMFEAIKNRLSVCLDSRSIDIHSAENAESPGDFLLHKYFSEKERNNYWPTKGSVEQFMAENPNSPIHHRFVIITDIPRDRTKDWIASVTEYLNHCPAECEHALFVLLTSRSNYTSSECMAVFNYDEYISEYDCLMLCMNLLSDHRCSNITKKYLAELAVQLANEQIEAAGRLAEYGIGLAKNPAGAVRSIMPEFEGEKLSEHVRQNVWEAQIRIVYPELEKFRQWFIGKYGDKLKRYLPIPDYENHVTREVGELELRQIYRICCSNPTLADKTDFDRLTVRRNARNRIAHDNIIEYAELEKMGIL